MGLACPHVDAKLNHDKIVGARYNLLDTVSLHSSLLNYYWLTVITRITLHTTTTSISDSSSTSADSKAIVAVTS